jgi:RloB-like protein
MTRKSNDLRRRRATRELKARMILVCEGRNTEPEYFRAIKRFYAKRSLEIVTVRAAGVPMTLAKKAKEEVKSLKNSIGTKGDVVCAIFDRDEHPKFEEAIAFCQRNGILVGYTNPCFELWLVWHFENYGSTCHRHDVQRRFATLAPEYNPATTKTADFSKLMGRIDDAVTRSQHHFEARENEGALYGAPSSLMHKIIERIKDFK